MEEMNEFESKPRGTFWRDWSVYGALALCLAIIGAAVAITSLPEKEEAQEPPQESIIQQLPEQAPVRVEKPAQAEEKGLPVIRFLPTATAETEPTPLPAEPTAAPNRSAADKKAQAPVAGQVICGYAADKLIYSKTLDQWTTHMAVDIA